MSNVDKRVVQMEFDNKQFEKDMQATVKSLKNFEKNINSIDGNTKAFNGLEKGLQNVQSNVKGFNLSPISDAFNKVKVTISGWEMAAMAAITRVVDGAMNAAQNMARSLIVDPVRQGFGEYELKMNSIQTIMMGSGASLDEVNKKLDELNTYADRTIYSLSDMTENIGKFINAGVGFDDSVAAIQGVSNVAAISGANANEAARAMYNFAQALSSGYVKLIDWKSIENANMATVEFKNELLKTAKALGTVVQEGDYYISTTTDANGKVSDAFNATKSFNDSLSAQWMTAEVLTETLKKYTDETTELGKKAFEAAQDLKTFSQLMDTLKEAVGSGWAQTWEIVFGNFDQAKNLWTSIGNVVRGFIDKQSEARNEMLKTWASMGGRASLLESFKNLFQNISAIIKPIKEAFQEIFPPLTANKLVSLTRSFAALVTKMEITKDEASKIKNIFKGVFSVFDILKQVIVSVFKVLSPFIKYGKIVLQIIGFIGEKIYIFNNWIKQNDLILKSLQYMVKPIQIVIYILKVFFYTINKIFDSLNISKYISKIKKSIASLGPSDAKPISDFSKSIDSGFKPLKKTFEFVDRFFSIIKKIAEKLSPITKPIAKSIYNIFSSLFNGIEKSINNLSLDKILKGGILATLIIFIKKISNIGKTFNNTFSGIKDVIDSFKNVLTNVSGVLKAYQQEIKADIIKKIAISLAILAASILVIASIPEDDLWKAIEAMTALFAELVASMKILTSGSSTWRGAFNISKIGSTMVKLAVSVLILAAAVKVLSKLSWEELEKGLIGIGALLFSLVLVSKTLNNKAKQMQKTAKAMILLSVAIRILASAALQFAKLSWEELGKAGAAIGGLALIFVSISHAFNKNAKGLIAGASAMIILTLAIKMLIKPIKTFSSMNWEELGKAGAAIGGLALIVSAFSRIVKGGTLLVASAGLLAFSVSLLTLIPIIKMFSNMNILDIVKSLGSLIAIIGIMYGASKLLKKSTNTLIKFGIALTLIGTGLSLLILPLSLLGLSIGEIVNAVVSLIKKIIELIPFLLKKIGEAIIDLFKIISDAAPEIGLAIKNVILSVLDVIKSIVPELIKTIDAILKELIPFLIKYVPIIADAIIKIILSVIDVIASNMPKIVASIGKLFSSLAAALKNSKSFNIKDLFWAIQAIALIAGLIYILQVISSDMGAAIKGIALMAIVLAALVGSLVIINQFTNPDKSIEILKGIATTLISLAGMFALVAGVAIAFEKLKISFTSILKAIGAFAVFLLSITVIVGLIGLIGNWIGSENIDNILNMAITIMSKVGQAIGSFMSSIAESLLKVIPDENGIAQILAIVPLILALEPLITALPILGALFLALGGIMAIIDGIFGEGTSKQLLELVNNVMPILAEGIGTFLGILIKKVLEIATSALMDSMVAFAEGLSDFMEALQPFLDSVKQIDGSMLEKVGMLTLMMLEMAAVELVSALTNFLTLFHGASSMAGFAKQLVDMAPYLVKFSSILKKGKFDSDITNKAANAALMLTKVANNLPKSGGLLQWFIGETMDMDDFGTKLEGLGKSLVKFGKQVNNLTPEQVESMGIAAEAATQLTEVAKSMPKSGGLWQRIVGETTNMDDFGTKLEGLGKSLVKFAKSVETITPTQITAVENTIPIMGSLVEIANDMPTEGGIWSKIVGDKMDMADFGGKLTALGEGLAGFAEKVKDVESGTNSASNGAVNICKDLVEISKSIGEEKSGGLAQWFGGSSKDDIESWGNKLPALGEGIAGFSDAVKNIKSVDSLSPVTAAIKTLSEIKLDNSISDTNFNQLLENIGWLANGVSGNDAYKGIDDFTTIANAFGDISAEASSAIKTKVENVSSAITSILKIANTDDDVNQDGFEQKLGLIHILHKGFGKDGYYSGTGDIKGIFDDFKNTNLDDAKKIADIINKFVEITNQSVSKDSFVGDTLDRIGKLVHGDGDDYEGIDDFITILDTFDWSVVNYGKQHAQDVKSALSDIIDLTNVDVSNQSFYDVLAQIGALAGNATDDIKYYKGPEDFKTILDKFADIKSFSSENINNIVTLLDGIIGAVNHDFDTEDFDDVLTAIGKLVYGGVGQYTGTSDFKKMSDTMANNKNLGNFVKALGDLVTITNTPAVNSDFSEKTLNRIGYIVNGNGAKYGGVQDLIKYANVFGGEVGNAAGGETRMKSVSNGVAAMIEAFNGISFGDDEATAFNTALQSVSKFTVVTTKEDIINKTEDILGAIKTLLKKMADAFVDKTEQSNLKTNVNTWVSNIKSAITASTSKTKEAMETLIKDVLKTVSSFNSQDPINSNGTFYSAGQNSAYGYIAGIKSRLQLIYNTGKLIGSEALKGTSEAIDSNSPSREYGKLAFYSIMGYVNTIKDKASLVFDAGSELGTNALNGTRGIITRISDIINSDMNLQPVISPILDLSEVSSQSGRIGGILNAGTSVIAANSASNLIEQGRMIRLDARLNQNGSPDVVDAITNLTNRMDSLEETIVNRPIMLDKTKVSKELTPEIDKNLGRRAYYSRRGN